VEPKTELSLEEQVEEAEKRVAEASRRREDRQRKDRLERALKRAEFTEIVDRLEEEHGCEGKGLAKYVTNSGKLIVVTAGQPTKLKKFRETKGTGHDVELFVKPHVVYPTAEEYDEIVHEEPAIRDPLGSLIVRLYGVQREEDEGK